MNNPNDDTLRGEQALAEEMLRMSIEKLLAPDEAEYIHGLDTKDFKVPEGFKALNARLLAAGEAELNTVPSTHAAELCWLNHLEPCAFPITLVARLLDTTARHIRAQVAQRVEWLHLDDDGRLYGVAP